MGEPEKITIARCKACGFRSVPYFGMFLPCRATSGGPHVEMESVEESRFVVAELLALAYGAVSLADRQRFDSLAEDWMIELALEAEVGG